MFLRNENITLRKLNPTDLPYLYLIENDEDSWVSSDVHNPLSHKDLADYIQSSTGDIFRDGQLRMIIETCDEDKAVLGCVDLFDVDIRNRRAAIGIYVIDEYRNNSIAAQAIRLVEKYASEFLKFRILYAFVATNNTPSMRLFEKLGFSQSSILQSWYNDSDAVIFSKQL